MSQRGSNENPPLHTPAERALAHKFVTPRPSTGTNDGQGADRKRLRTRESLNDPNLAMPKTLRIHLIRHSSFIRVGL